MESFFERISHPLLNDLQIDWGGWQVAEVYPRVVPDLFPGRPVILSGRFSGEPGRAVRIRGVVANAPVELATAQESSTATHPALAALWARKKIAGLSEEFIDSRNHALIDAIKQVALDHGLLSAYTSFIAIDSTQPTPGPVGTTVPVAVPVPQGVSYEKTLNQR